MGCPYEIQFTKYRRTFGVYKFLNVEITSDDDIIYNSKTGSSVGKITIFWGLVPNVLARLIINKQILPSLQPNIFLWCWKRKFSSLRRKDMSLLMNPFVFVHLDMLHTNAMYEWCSMKISVETHYEGQHLSCMTTHGHGLFVRVVT